MNNIKKYGIIFIAIAFIFSAGFYYFTNIYGYNSYIVHDGDKTIKIKSRLNVVKEILKEKNISYKNTDVIKPSLDSKVEDLATIQIARAKNIVFYNGGKKTTVASVASTVAEFLKEQKVELEKDDIINVSLESKISEKKPIKIDYIRYKNVTRTEVLKFKKTEKNSEFVPEGETKVGVKGVNGSKEIKEIQKYVNGKLAATYLESRRIVKKPINEEVLIGTKEKEEDYSSSSEDEDDSEESTEAKQQDTSTKVSSNNTSKTTETSRAETSKSTSTKKSSASKSASKSSSSKSSSSNKSSASKSTSKKSSAKKSTKKSSSSSQTSKKSGKYIMMTATAYNLKGTTASGMASGFGKVAVDPNVIPLGTKLKIESTDSWPSYGYAVAADTGGAIKGNRIDLFYDSYDKCIRFGRRTVKVYILD